MFTLFEKSESLVSGNFSEYNKVVSQNSVERKEHNTLEKTVKKLELNPPFVSKDTEWCETEQYQDLSKHTAIVAFDNWLQTFEAFQCFKKTDCEHDPRIKTALLKRGEYLARERAKIFIQIIRGDPRKALEIAVGDEQSKSFPASISQHIEQWISTYANITAIHICGDPSKPLGQIKRYATIANNKKVEAHFYGKRKYLRTINGLSVWGISMGNDAAFSETALKVTPIKSNENQQFEVKLGNLDFVVASEEGVLALQRRIKVAEESASYTGWVHYPLIASSDGTLNLIDARYKLINSLVSWKQAHQFAIDSNATLVNINSAFENNIVFTLLKDAKAMGLFPVSESNVTVQYSWIGATDNEYINGFVYNKSLDLYSAIDLNASEGNWKWSDGVDVNSSGYSKWKNEEEPSSSFIDQDYAAIDFNSTDSDRSSWLDLNNSYRLPFIIERPTQSEVKPLASVNGKRKVLVIPARFRDEGNNFDGSSSNPTDQFGNPLSSNNGNDNFEPDTRENITNTMEGVKEFYLRNSDGTFELDYVIAPTVTLDIPKWEKVAYDPPLEAPQEPNLFDQTGRYFEQKEIEYIDPHLSLFGQDEDFGALVKASEVSRQYNFEGPAFEGILSVFIKSPVGPYKKPPLLTFVGGNIQANGILDPDFVSAQGEVVLDSLGYVSEIRIIELGAYYHSVPSIKLNGVDFNSTFFSPEKDRTVVSWVLSTSYGFGAAGLGYVGAPGSYVMAPMSPGVTVHELGHNFGLWHANRHEGEGIRPNSDDRTVIDYGNPYSVMGTGGASGDFTISSKVFLNEVGSFGYAGGNIKNPSEFNSKKVDVADLSSAEEVSTSLLKENGAVNSNTFRIYRHDYGFAPYSLSNAEFELEIPNSALPSKFSEYLLDQNFSLLIGGPGEGGSGHIAKGGIFGHKLVITEGGKGYSEEPTIDVLNDSNENLLRISPTWIKRKAGTEHYEIDSIRNLSPVGLRGLRGVEIPASQYSPLGFDAETVMGSYWVSYRRKISEFGLSVINATKRSPDGSENIFLDMTPHTQGIVNESTNPGTDFDDAFLMLGSTFSDYESDSHITPIRKGGIPPMDYIEAVVNIGTVGSGIAKAPKFKLEVSNSSPIINELVSFTVRPDDGNYSNYAYSWLINEVGFSEFGYLNRSAISQKFSSIGYQVVKVLVSDMKGGISSRNITVNVGGAEKSKYSIASGQVNSSKGPIQGAKVVFKKAEIIEHSVGVSGNIQDSRLNTTHGNPQHFVIDNERDKQLIMHRGEIHRFTFESSSNNLPLSFFESPEHESANVRLNLLFSPSVETAGGGYTKTPLIDLNETSRFDSTYSQKITTLDLFQNELSGLLSWDDFQFGTLITKPTAKSLLADTVVSRIIVRPIKVDSITGLPIHFGGRGMDPEHPPPVTVLRSSYWEDYSDANATANAYVDGVGTIGLHSNSGGTGYSTVPDIVVLGAGQDANYTASVRAKKNDDPSYKRNNILETPVTVDQGFGYDGNSTLAVALYPTEPFAYWSFNEAETLFKNGVLKPTSGFNLPIEDGLIGYWKMDEENATTFPEDATRDWFLLEDNSTQGNDLNVTRSGIGAFDSVQRSFWGTKNRSIGFEENDTAVVVNNPPICDSSSSGAFTFSCWVAGITTPHRLDLSLGDFRVEMRDNFINLFHPFYNPQNNSSNSLVNSPAQAFDGTWTHVSLRYEGSNQILNLFINGEEKTLISINFDHTQNSKNLKINFVHDGTTDYENILLDEVMVYNRALTESEIGQLAGNIFLDLSGNKYNAVARGTGFEMTTPVADAGSVTNTFSPDLGEAISLDGSVSSRYLDLSTHVKPFSGLDKGTIAFWVNPASLAIDMPILSASNTDDNQSYFRVMLKDNGKIRTEAFNEGTEFCNVTSGGSATISPGNWFHVAMLVGDAGISYYIDGKSIPPVVSPGSSNTRVFFADIDKLDYLAIGRHEDSNTTSYFNGELDEMQIFQRELSSSEIQHLYNTGKETYVARALLTANVDAIGSVILSNNGAGYKEVPDVNFTTSFYFGNTDYPDFEAPAGGAELNATFVDKILLTKEFDSSVTLILPDGRKVLRMNTEYVMRDDINPIDGKADVPVGLYGYSSPPNIAVEGSPSYPEDLNATGYSLFFLDVNDSVEIYNGGSGYVLDAGGKGFNLNSVRIFGEGYRPPQFDAKIRDGRVDALVLTQPGEGYYAKNPSSSDIIYLGEGEEIDPEYVPGGDRAVFEKATDDYRRNTDKEEKKGVNYEVITGINLNADPDKRGSGWVSPPTVFADWGDESWVGHVGVSSLEFNSSISNIIVQNQGFGYTMPVEITVVDGRPSLSPAYVFLGSDQNNSFIHVAPDFISPKIEISSVDDNGAITGLNLLDGGFGFEPSVIGHPAEPVDDFGRLKIVVTGGGGRGAEIYGYGDTNGSLSKRFYIANGGQGYFNTVSTNFPRYTLKDNGITVSTSEQNATLYASLGGSLKEPNVISVSSIEFNDGESIISASGRTNEEIHYAAPWIMILDKGRAEKDINADERAHATARVVDGNITKIIVTKSGEGYIDPHVVICGTAPKYGQLNNGVVGNAWQWRCMNLRETIDGNFSHCGHVDIGSAPYPPEKCPGEKVNAFRTDTAWDTIFENWEKDHSKNHPECPRDSNHRNNIFVSPMCSGKKSNFVLINDYYRANNSNSLHVDFNTSSTYEKWLPFETNCSVTAKDGKIREIFINSFGSKYLAPKIIIEGSGGGVDPIPVFNEEGILTKIFYNDRRLKNLELDQVDFPIGAGQGYLPKPWGKDYKYSPTFGINESIRCQIFADISYWDGDPGPEYEVYDIILSLANRVEVKDAYGDRLSNVQILEPTLGGLAPNFILSIDYNTSHIPDRDLDGQPDFIQATALVETTNILTNLVLDGNGSFLESDYLLDAGNRENVWRNTFLAEPDVTIFNQFNGVTHSQFKHEDDVDNIILSGHVAYNMNPLDSYLDIVVDDNLPNKFFYGMSNSNHSDTGGEILIYDGMPGMNWGVQNDWDRFALTDEFGMYTIPNLEPGFYNIAVLMEDENLQDLALRPDSDSTLFSRTLYVPGFSQVILETDQRGKGASRLVWSEDSRQTARFYRTTPQKELGGIGGGFISGDRVQLIIEPHPSNTSFGQPNILPSIEVDGSLTLKIIDDMNSSVFDPSDRFTVRYSSSVTGIDFSDKYEKSFLNNSFLGGNKGAIDANNDTNQTLILTLSPQSGSLFNLIEAPIRSQKDPNASMIFTFSAYDQNGSPFNCSDVIWSLSLDENITDGVNWDGNHSKVAQLESPQYYYHGTSGQGFGYYYPLYTQSVYQDNLTNGSGIYDPVDANLSGGYHEHNFADSNLPFFMEEGNVNHAVDSLPSGSLLLQGKLDYNETSQIKLILHSGLKGKGLTLTATLNGQSVSTQIEASKRSVLTEEELWYDQYFDTIRKPSILTSDEDNDSLTLAQEWENRTNPLNADTDGDGLYDNYEISKSKTNPRSSDTDGDGFSDNTELTLAGLDPLVFNSAPPLPIMTALNTSGSILSVTAGNKITLGAKVTEVSLSGQSTDLAVSLEGNFSEIISLVNQEWVANISAASGSYIITYRAVDSLKRNIELTQTIIVTAIDVTKPIISLSNNGPIYILKGSFYTLPTVTALDNVDGVLTSSVIIEGESMVDLNKTGTYSINYSVSDTAGNIANATLNLVVEDFAFTLNGKAIDGYLTGSTVLFDGKADVGGFDGLHDLDRSIITDASGSFSLQLTASELSAFDSNNNGLLDASEGRIIIIGGYDPTIDTNFTGRYQTDVNSSVVSPLSTLVTAVMDQGLSKEEAKNKVISAFGLPTTIDPTNYDPIAASLTAESTSTQYLLATARLANAMKQADALGGYLSIPTTSAGQVSTAFVSQLAQSLSSSLLSLNPLDDSAVLNQAFSASLQSVQSNANISEVSSAVTLLQSADNLLVQTINAGGTPNILAVSLAKNQQAVEDAIIEGYSNPSLKDLSTLASTATTSSIQLASNSISSINVFPPVAENFQSSIRAASWLPGSLLMNISASDGDGDLILYSITTANFDLDADGNNPFILSSSGALSINDIDDLLPYAGTTVNIKLSLSDGKGMATTIVGALSIDNKLSLDSTPVNGKQGWVESAWFKTFYSAGARWIYHPAHEWLYVSPDNLDGYWFWDSNSSIWWWTKPTIYPYFYRSNGIWNYWHFNQNSRVYFDYQSKLWVTP